MSAQHTPWRVLNVGDSLQILDGLRDTVLTLPASDANAVLCAVISRAVNSHDVLVVALQAAEVYVQTAFAEHQLRRKDGSKLPDDHPVRLDLAQIQAALAAAKAVQQ